ncbi:MAG: alpha/beta fold hydrolase [Thiomicrospira sp.]|jgi:pimeloyl-ACP methyl ester carboxylesterase|nr:alpha/beta fold hydrolase [Thiomicrospira sp.]
MTLRLILGWQAWLWLSLLLLSGCASVTVSSLDSREYISLKRGDILTSGKLSAMTANTLQGVGETPAHCRYDNQPCIEALTQAGLSDGEQSLAALAELWLQRALMLEADAELAPTTQDAQMRAYLESARYAFVYLFATPRQPAQRTFEDRQIQVRDYYNYATQQVTTRLFNHYRAEARVSEAGEFFFNIDDWVISGRLNEVRLAAGRRIPDDVQAASSLTFSGLRNQYKQQGLGAGLVAITRALPPTSADPRPWSETPFSPLTSLLVFDGADRASLLQTRQAFIHGFDPYQATQVELMGERIPLEADFTSPYGLWLARSNFASQPFLTLLGWDDGLQEPHIFLMQPYDPNRKIIVMLHGLASSPQAWVNVANDLLGDDVLRAHYQIWQVYYPTNVPLMFNRLAIQQALEDALQYFDPQGIYPASQDMVLIGHSMGGVLSRLLVSTSPPSQWQRLVAHYHLSGERLVRAEQHFEDLVVFEPTPQVSRAIFISAPHRGTPIAAGQFARWLAGLVKLPGVLISRTTELMSLLANPDGEVAMPIKRSLNSIDNLSEDNPFLRMTVALPISPRVTYHTIMGVDNSSGYLEETGDGVVPYSSAHLSGAVSEKLIAGGHSIQETPQAIGEIRRILLAHLQALTLISPRNTTQGSQTVVKSGDVN